MKNLIIFVMFITITCMAFAQVTTLIDTDFEEEGNNGWTLVNGTAENQWWVANPFTDSSENRYIFISNDGWNHAYNPAAASLVHFYCEFEFPPNAYDIKLSFKIKVNGEYDDDLNLVVDGVRVYLHDISEPVPVANPTPPTPSAGFIGDSYYNLSAEWTTKEISIPNGTVGNKRLVFSWFNDYRDGDQPPAAIDDIKLVYGSDLITIGDGTATQPLPINPAYRTSYSQTIYYKSQIEKSGYIRKIYFQWNGVNAAPNSNEFTVYMGHTTTTNFPANQGDSFSSRAWIPQAQLRKVFEGTVNITATPGWIEIVLDEAFPYNNVGNLVIAVHETLWGTGNDGMSARFLCTSTLGTNRGIILTSDVAAGIDLSTLATTDGQPIAAFANLRIGLEEAPISDDDYTEPIAPIPSISVMASVYPNPLRSGHGASFAVENKGREAASMRIFNVKGQLIKEYHHITAGKSTLTWDMKDAQNRNVSSGIYFYQIANSSGSKTQKMVVVK